MLINNFDRLESQDNAGGAQWFQVVKPEDVATFPDVVLESAATALTLNSGAYAYNIMATVGTVVWSESTSMANGRPVYTARLTFVIPKDRNDILTYARHLNNRGVVAIVTDANGQRRLMGTPNEPATFGYATRTTGNFDARNEFQFEIYVESPNPIPFYQPSANLPAPANVCPPFPAMSVAVYADAGLTTLETTPDFGDTVYVKLSTIGITATSYTFRLPVGFGKYEEVTQASDTYAWTVDFVGTQTVYATATDAVYGTSTVSGVSVTVAGYPLDYVESIPDCGCALQRLTVRYTGDIVNIRRSSDNAQSDFTYDELADGTAVTWVGGGNTGYVSVMYDQTGNNRHMFQTNNSYQGIIIESGAVVTDAEGNFAYRNQNGTQAMRVYGSLRGSAGAVFMATNISGISTGSQAWMFTSAGNPAVGTYSNNPSDTSSPTTSSGSPSYHVNNASVVSQRGPLGSAIIGDCAIFSATSADFSNSWRNNDIATVMLYGNTSSKLSCFISFNKFDSAERSTLTNALNDVYGYY